MRPYALAIETKVVTTMSFLVNELIIEFVSICNSLHIVKHKQHTQCLIYNHGQDIVDSVDSKMREGYLWIG